AGASEGSAKQTARKRKGRLEDAPCKVIPIPLGRAGVRAQDVAEVVRTRDGTGRTGVGEEEQRTEPGRRRAPERVGRAGDVAAAELPDAVPTYVRSGVPRVEVRAVGRIDTARPGRAVAIVGRRERRDLDPRQIGLERDPIVVLRP